MLGTDCAAAAAVFLPNLPLPTLANLLVKCWRLYILANTS